MEQFTSIYRPESGWARELPADLDSPQTLVILFGGSRLSNVEQLRAEICRVFPTAQLIGCSTAGEIHETTISDNSLVIAVVRFAHTRLKAASAAVERTDASCAAGETLAAALRAPDLRGVFILSEGKVINGSALVAGLNQNLPPDVVVTGGLAGDGPDFETTWVVDRHGKHTQQVLAVGFYGKRIQLQCGSRGGWHIFGPERRVTRATDNILYELDGRPALELYKRYLGDLATDLPAAALLFPLALRPANGNRQQVVRTVLGIDERQNAMIFAGDVPVGHRAQLMRANQDNLIDGAAEAAMMALGDADPPNLLSIAISCVGRRLVLGERTEEELEAVLESLPPGTKQVGFYSYGEISPVRNGFCDLHNQTMTLTTISER
jgi:hypothetical protein